MRILRTGMTLSAWALITWILITWTLGTWILGMMPLSQTVWHLKGIKFVLLHIIDFALGLRADLRAY